MKNSIIGVLALAVPIYLVIKGWGIFGTLVVSFIWWAILGFVYAVIKEIENPTEDKPAKTPKKSTTKLAKSATVSNMQLWTGEKQINIDYFDAEGKESNRSITIESIEVNTYGDVYLRAFCHLMDAPRSFRLDRIDTFYDNNGVVVDKSEIFAELGISDKVKTVEEMPKPERKQRAEIVTTDEELAAFNIICAMLYESLSVSRIKYKDTATFFGINVDGQASKTFCRLRLGKQKNFLGIINAGEKETKYEIKALKELNNYQALIAAAVQGYL